MDLLRPPSCRLRVRSRQRLPDLPGAVQRQVLQSGIRLSLLHPRQSQPYFGVSDPSPCRRRLLGSHRDTSRTLRAWLWAFVGLLLVTLVLLYERFPLLVGAADRGRSTRASRRIPESALLGHRGRRCRLDAFDRNVARPLLVDLFKLGSVHTKPLRERPRRRKRPRSRNSNLRDVPTSILLSRLPRIPAPPTDGGRPGMSDTTGNSPAESAVIASAAEIGIAGAVGLCLMFVTSLVGAWRALRTRQDPLVRRGRLRVWRLCHRADAQRRPAHRPARRHRVCLRLHTRVARRRRASRPSKAWSRHPDHRDGAARRWRRPSTTRGLVAGRHWLQRAVAPLRPPLDPSRAPAVHEPSRLGASHVVARDRLRPGPRGPRPRLRTPCRDDWSGQLHARPGERRPGGYLFAPWLASLFGVHTADAVVRALVHRVDGGTARRLPASFPSTVGFTCSCARRPGHSFGECAHAHGRRLLLDSGSDDAASPSVASPDRQASYPRVADCPQHSRCSPP